MVKITNDFGDIKQGKQGENVYQLHYGQQMRRTLKPKSTAPSQMQLNQRTRFQQALSWRATLSRTARIYLEGYAIAHRVIDSYGVPLSWDKVALKIALEIPTVTILN
jgi:hypothetical protein